MINKCTLILKLLAAGLFLLGTTELSCDTCYSLKKKPCELKCAKLSSLTERERCEKRCTVRECKDPCGYKNKDQGSAPADREKTAGLSDGEQDCDYCLRSVRPGCEESCRKDQAFDFGDCKDQCSKLKCQRACRLPALPGPRTKAPEDPHACPRCQKQAQNACAQRCGRDKDRAG